jgi:hypothetical protein
MRSRELDSDLSAELPSVHQPLPGVKMTGPYADYETDRPSVIMPTNLFNIAQRGTGGERGARSFQ